MENVVRMLQKEIHIQASELRASKEKCYAFEAKNEALQENVDTLMKQNMRLLEKNEELQKEINKYKTKVECLNLDIMALAKEIR